LGLRCSERPAVASPVLTMTKHEGKDPRALRHKRRHPRFVVEGVEGRIGLRAHVELTRCWSWRRRHPVEAKTQRRRRVCAELRSRGPGGHDQRRGRLVGAEPGACGSGSLLGWNQVHGDSAGKAEGSRRGQRPGPRDAGATCGRHPSPIPGTREGLPGERRRLQGEARVRSSFEIADAVPPRYEIGIEFLDMSSEARERLNGFVAWLAALPSLMP
jgi:hypothetical protein